MPYADAEFYTQYSGDIPLETIEMALRKASRHIDTLTYNRIVGKGFENLTAYQQQIIKECCCDIADFEYDNAEYTENILQEYGINGVSMKFGASWNVYIQGGVAVKADIYQELSKTGLCCRRIAR